MGIFLVFGLILFSACQTAKKLEPGKVLYTGANVEFSNTKKINTQSKLEEQIYYTIQPKANAQLLGANYKLWIYQRFGKKNKKEKTFGKSIRKKFGEPPAIMDTTKARLSTYRIQKYMQDQGYFGSKVTYTVNRKKKAPRASVNYTITSKGQYTLSEYFLPDSLDPIGREIRFMHRKTFIRLGEPYQLSTLQAERDRVSYHLRKSGYADFNSSNLYFNIDTVSGSRSVRVELKVKEPVDSSGYHRYVIGKVFIYPSYTLDDSLASIKALLKPNSTFIGEVSPLKESTLLRNILIRAGELYSQKNHDYTLRHLLDLGIYKFVSIKYNPYPETSKIDSLSCHIYLTPQQMQEVSADVEADFRTGIFSGYGTSLSFNYRHNNLFRGAEKLNITLSGSTVFQPGDTTAVINTLDASLKADLYFPRFLTPFNIKNVSQYYLPQTRISASANYQGRIGFYALGSYGLSLSYLWKENEQKSHQFSPLSILNIDLLRTTDDFDSVLTANPFLRSSFENVMILGIKYAYTFQGIPRSSRDPYFYFRGGVEFSGNLTGLAMSLIEQNTSRPKEILGRPFAQYSRPEADFRAYLPLGNDQLVAGKIAVGAGIPYGNSEVLPYLKQFYIGGPISLRGFGLRTLGPGSYQQESAGDEIGFVDQTGDMLIEGSLEYRFPIAGYLKGGLFVDAGNVWLLPTNSDITPSDQEKTRREEGLFNLSRFPSQIAVGAGIGFRFDVDFFVLRFDLAFPLRKPFLPEGERWVIRNMRPTNWGWLNNRENAILNIAIGYPF
ncbi:BamA/TamA family outer membrane protein [bacterium]|nr:BamA/TamA family outer membrane protein [bacterium]